VSGPFSKIKHLVVSRVDWNSAGFILEDALNFAEYDDILIDKPDQMINVGGTAKWIAWHFDRNSGGNSFYSGVAFQNLGTMPICWSYGQNGGGLSANDVCVGIRTDNRSTNSASRAVLGFLGTLGPVTAWGIDKNGVVNRVQGGLPTGAGVPGDIAFSTGNTGASGMEVKDGTDRWLIRGPTGHLLPNADNTYDIGAGGANRPRDLWVGRNTDIAGNLTVHGTCIGCGGGSAPLPSRGDVEAPHSIPWITASSGAGNTLPLPSTANKAAMYGVVLTFPLITTEVTYNVTMADASVSAYDIGIYDDTGKLKMHTGPVAGTIAMTSGVHTAHWTTRATLKPGKYYLAIASSCTTSCGQMAATDANGVTFLSNFQINVSVSGTLNENIKPLSDTFTFSSNIPAWIVQ
jgi:hypothetical protein